MGVCILLFAVFVGFILIMRARRRLHAKEAPPPPVFDPIELQTMLDSGSITAAEYDRLRLALAKRAEAEPLRGAGGFEVLPVPAKRADDTSSGEVV